MDELKYMYYKWIYMSYDRPLLKEFINIVIGASHISAEIFTFKNKFLREFFSHRKNYFPIGYQEFPTVVREFKLHLLYGFKIR